MKSVLIYLILVGLPVYGVYSIVRMGEKLTPPVSIGGVWRFEAAPDSVCGGHPFPDSLVATVDQSGPNLRVQLNKLANPLAGKLTGTNLDVTNGHLRLQATLAADTSAHAMTGSLSGLTCAGTLPVSVSGKRSHSAAGSRAH
ncbi:MAG: hypothetical protein ABI679_03570 [Gemmatimonadota bacterium]